MSDANVVAQTLQSTMDRQARTRESYEQEIANLSSKLIELRATVGFIQQAIDNFGKDEEAEAAHLAELQKVLEACAIEEENANKQIKEEREAALREAERIEALRPAWREAQSEDWHRAQVAVDAENFKRRKEFYEKQLSGQAYMEQAMSILEEVKKNRKKKKRAKA